MSNFIGCAAPEMSFAEQMGSGWLLLDRNARCLSRSDNLPLLFEPEQADWLIRLTRQIFADGKQKAHEATDEQRGRCEVEGLMIDWRVIGLDRLLVQVHHRRAQQVFMRALSKAIKRDQKEAITAGVIHELNNHLSGLCQQSQALQRRLTGDTQRHRDMAERFHLDWRALQQWLQQMKCAEMATQLGQTCKQVSELLLQVREHGLPSETYASDFNVVIKRAVALANKQGRRCGVNWQKIRVSYQLQPCPELTTQWLTLQQVLINLLNNAAQAIARNSADGKGDILIGSQACGSDWRLDVKDSGGGIASERLPGLFAPFVTDKPRRQGSGLGLYISRFLVQEQLGGQLVLNSNSQQGACFSVYLPLEKPPDPHQLALDLKS